MTVKQHCILRHDSDGPPQRIASDDGYHPSILIARRQVHIVKIEMLGLIKRRFYQHHYRRLQPLFSRSNLVKLDVPQNLPLVLAEIHVFKYQLALGGLKIESLEAESTIMDV